MMTANDFKAHLSKFLWKTNFAKFMAAMEFNPNHDDEWQSEFWENINNLNSALCKIDAETFAKLTEVIASK